MIMNNISFFKPPNTLRLVVFALFLYPAARAGGEDVKELIEKQVRKNGYYLEEVRRTWDIKAGGSQSESTYYFEYRVTNSQGWKKILPIMIPHSGESRVDRVKITVVEGSNKPKEYGRKKLLDSPAYPGFILYSDQRALVFFESFMAEQGTVTLSYRRKESRPVLSRSFLVQSHVPIKKRSISIKAPKNWKIENSWRNGPPGGEIQHSPNVFLWIGAGIQPLLEEVYSPPAAELARQVVIKCQPPEKDPKIWAFSNWNDIGVWYQRLYLPRVSVTPEMEESALAAVQGAETPLEKIRRLYELVQERTRYVAIEIGIGGFQPHPAPQTFEKKYGDCKDMATLLCALLKSVGIDACLVLVRTQNAGRVLRDFPTPYQFNHAIAYVPASQYLEQSLKAGPIPGVLQDGIFLDPTSDMCPFGDLPMPDQDTWALVVSGAGGELKKIPSQWLQPDKTVRVTRIKLQANGHAACSVIERHYGWENQHVRYLLRSMDVYDRQKYWSQRLNEYFPRSKFSELKINNKEDISLPLEFRSQFSVRNFAQRSGSLMIFPAMYWMIFKKNPFSEKTRVHPVLSGYRPVVIDTLHITLPGGYNVDALPGATGVSKQFGEFVLTFEVGNQNSVMVARSCRFSQAEIPCGQYEAFRGFIDTLIKKETESIVLKKN
ncbi:MAG: transglutaminase domain-containing protein [Gemmatimonadota bacterium]|nr:transglutaminase domain-containing protein [Gemmatimonadota bacterium]